MSKLKEHLAYEGQVVKLRDRGCIINDDETCKNVLEHIGYYRLSAYFLPSAWFLTFITTTADKKCFAGANYNEIVS